VSEDADIFILLNKQISHTPEWIKDFEDAKQTMANDLGEEFNLFRKRARKNERIFFWSVPGSDRLYTIIARTVTNMQPAYDLRPITSYKTDVAIFSGGIQKEVVNARESAVVKTNGLVNIQWPVQTGVADIYSITVKYYYPAETGVKGTIQLIGAGNNRMLEEPVSFKFTRDGKWNQFTINTANMINAGNYIVKLEVENAKDLIVSGIDIQ
jgi:hypothetical protein